HDDSSPGEVTHPLILVHLRQRSPGRYRIGGALVGGRTAEIRLRRSAAGRDDRRRAQRAGGQAVTGPGMPVPGLFILTPLIKSYNVIKGKPKVAERCYGESRFCTRDWCACTGRWGGPSSRRNMSRH